MCSSLVLAMTMNHVRDTYLCTYGGGVRDMYVLYGGGERYICSEFVDCGVSDQTTGHCPICQFVPLQDTIGLLQMPQGGEAVQLNI